MPKHKKKGKQHEDEDFDDMLAEFQASDLAAASDASSTAFASSSSVSARMDERISTTSPPSPSLANTATWDISEEAIVIACRAGNLSQLRQWGHHDVRVRTGEPLSAAVWNEVSFDVLFCLVKELLADVNHGPHATCGLFDFQLIGNAD
jgi:hypothetical protein